MALGLARWGCEFLGNTWSNKSDANPPDGDKKPPGAITHEVCCLAAQYHQIKIIKSIPYLFFRCI